jgi:hypothetical protein
VEGRRFSLAHSGTITALKSSWTVTPLFFASEDITANAFSLMQSMNLGMVKALPMRQLSLIPYNMYITFYTPSKDNRKPSHVNKNASEVVREQTVSDYV